jgi:hypothetical protein
LGFSIVFVDILISPFSEVLVCGVLRAEFPDCDCRKSARRSGAAGNQGCGGYAYWTHGVSSLVTCGSLIAMQAGEGVEKVQLRLEQRKTRG